MTGRRRLPALHPLTVAFGVTVLAQVVGLFVHYFGVDDAGHRVFSSPINMLMIAVPLYVSWLCVIGALFAALSAAVPARVRPLVTTTGLVTALALLVLVPLDFAMQHFRGERLTLAQLRTYGPSGLLNSDVSRPVLQDPWYPIVTLGISLMAIVLFLALWRAARGRATRPPGWRAASVCALLGAACYAPTRLAYYHQRDMAAPPEVLIARALLYPSAPLSPEREAADRAALRAFLDPAGRARWLSDAYPLAQSGPRPTPADRAAAADPPDIIFFVVESLRGRDVGYGLYPPSPGTSPTPHLDALARESVIFPQYIASGEPSPRGFITINTGVWEHARAFIIADYPNTVLDALPLRLRSRGYHTMALYGGNPGFDNQLMWARRWYDEIDYELPGNGLFYFHTRSDSLVMDHFIRRVQAHDARAPSQPLFAYVASNGTHTPYVPEDGSARPGEGPAERYARCLRNLDARLGRVLDYLATRRRAGNTVIVVIGDHSDKTDESFDERLRGLPVDAFVWTGALIHGPARLVGPPRREEFAASHVDLFPTVLSWVGDDAPRVTVGHDLFAPMAATPRTAVSVNSRGYREDRDGFTMIVDRTNVTEPIVYRSFPRQAPEPLPLAGTPFAPGDAQQLVQRMEYWTSLIEANRVWRPELLTAGDASPPPRR